MQLVFLTRKNAFFWDRAATLNSCSARNAGFSARSIFDSPGLRTGDVLFFSRFSDSAYFRLARLCKIPYVLDIDDLYWSLPEFSSDQAGKDSSYVSYIDTLAAGAALITTTTDVLQSKLAARHPGSAVSVVRNAPPAWHAPLPAVLIANTDNFKLAQQDTKRFREILSLIIEAGCAVQLIGDNQSLLNSEDAISYYSLPLLSLEEYHRQLQQGAYILSLIPVGNSDYADCKSSIKALEFLQAGIPVIASDIAPYRTLRAGHPGLDLTLVANSPDQWRQAVQESLKRIPANELSYSSGINRSLDSIRRGQLSDWRGLRSQIEPLAMTAGQAFVLNTLLPLYRSIRCCFKVLRCRA